MVQTVFLEDFPPLTDSDKPSKFQWLLYILANWNTQTLYKLHRSVFVCFVRILEHKII
jgi:hypothetical protein